MAGTAAPAKTHTVLEPAVVAGVQLRNRVMMSPMSQHRASGDGRPNDWHLVHYGSRAVGGVGLIMLEDTAVRSDGRLGVGALGLYNDGQIGAFKHVVDFCHAAGAAVGAQLGHAGRKAFVVDGGNPEYQPVAPSALPFDATAAVPRPLGAGELPAIVASFVEAAGRALEAGVDLVEIHAGHGYLLHEFLSPTSNQRQDDYGGDLAGRARLLLEVIDAVRAAYPQAHLSARISATDLLPDGNGLEENIALAGWIREHGIDLIDVSAGGLNASPVGAHSADQPALAATIRQQAGVATIGVGGVKTIDDADALIDAGSCDLVGIGRALLTNPFWVREIDGSAVPVKPTEHIRYGSID